MNRISIAARATLLLLTLAAACGREPAPVEELYATRMLGLGHLQRNELADAEKEFRKLTELAPDDAFGHAYLGLTWLQAGRFPEAEKELERARKLEPRSAEIGLMLSRLYALTNRPADAREVLEALRRDSTTDAHVLYALAELDAEQRDAAAAARYVDRLRDVLAIAPANLVARLRLVDVLARRGESDSVVRHLEEVRRIPPALPREARTRLDSTITLLRAGKGADARATLDRMLRLVEVTAPYQASLEEVKWSEGPIPGRLVLTFAPPDFVSVHGVRERAAVEVAKFVDATAEAGFVEKPPQRARTGALQLTAAIAAGDINGDGSDELLLSAEAEPRVARIYNVQGGFVRDMTARTSLSLPGGAVFAIFADVDNDGWLDLFAVGADRRAHLLRNRGEGIFVDATASSRLAGLDSLGRAIFADVDHDGDLDLIPLGRPAHSLLRNDGNGVFTDVGASYGLVPGAGSRDAVFGDFDDDGRIDVFVARGPGSDALFRNGGADRFSDVTAASGIGGGGSGAAAVGDYDNDGALDVFVARIDGGEPAFWRNSGNGTFTRDRRSTAVAQALRRPASTASFVDYDNDGWLDLVVGGAGGVFVFRNDGTGRFVDRSSILPATARDAGATTIAVSDVDRDGDEDLVATDDAGQPRLLRNEMGNSNLGINVELKALRDGSGKNNTFGVGARLSLRAGTIYQTRVATRRVTHFGLGQHLKADVLRVEWPNGVPQTVYFPGSDEDVVEREMLKGSCGFVYTWDGSGFRFVTDAMWRSALGMPLGLMGSTSAFAPAGASQEYVRIDGRALKPRDGRYVVQLTEELWETAYADEVKLVAVDHPDSLEVFVDERFVPPGPVRLKLYPVGRRTLPLSAVDERGNDMLPALRETDDVYVSNFTPTKYQGVVETHDLVLDLGPEAGKPGTHLFLRGWIYPTDASINVALGQQSALSPFPPSLEVRDARGRWTRAADIGFPSGKDKTIVVDLAGKFPTADRHVRIRTSMQIYWDEAFVGHTLPDGAAKVSRLAPLSVDLHYRGFSRMYRKGGRHGPYWFAYDDVTKDSPWRPIEGAFTRFGDVLPLLRDADDMYVIMGPGDEATIEFDAASADSLPRGWTRTFLLYTDGWIKDSDLNTAHGTTVEPLPFHAAKSYPFARGEGYPTDSLRARYRRDYNTRVVRGFGAQR